MLDFLVYMKNLSYLCRQTTTHEVMNILKIVSGKVEIRKESGFLIRTI